MRGPLLYCVEQADNQGFDLRDLVLPDGADLAAEFEPGLLNGVVVLRGQAVIDPPDPAWHNRLYRQQKAVTNAPATGHQTVSLTAIPYYAWANREPGQMLVWLRSK
jgi:DUF1680 family protein